MPIDLYLQPFNLITLLSLITIGRTFRLCGALGVIIMLFVPGIIIGPPQLKEYPVDPVGVDTTSPSAQYVFKNSFIKRRHQF